MVSKEFIDSYANIPPPDPKTVCLGRCNGTGVVSLSFHETDPKWKKMWDEAGGWGATKDGWHFVKCPDCNGSGKRDVKNNSPE